MSRVERYHGINRVMRQGRMDSQARCGNAGRVMCRITVVNVGGDRYGSLRLAFHGILPPSNHCLAAAHPALIASSAFLR